jgi:hypothetical protein
MHAFVQLFLDGRTLDRLVALGFLHPGVANPELIRDAAAAALAAMLQSATPSHGRPL